MPTRHTASKYAPLFPGLGRRVRALRHELGWSLSVFAEKTNYSRSALIDVEQGRALPRDEMLQTVAGTFSLALGRVVAAGDLLGEREGHATVLCARLRRGLRQEELAERVRVNHIDIVLVERDGWIPPADVRKRLAEALEESEEYLFGRLELEAQTVP